MSSLDLDKLRPAPTRCPSDLVLEELDAGELAGPARARARAHIATCPRCTERMAAYAAGFARHPEVDPEALLATIRRGADRRPSPRPSAPERLAAALLRWLAPAVAVGAVLVAGLTADDGRDGLRAKGGAALHVHRLGAHGAAEVMSGDVFHAGDRLRFVVDLPADGEVAIVGVEASGALYTAWPPPGAAPFARVAAGRRQGLDGAVALDRTTGRETLWLVHCPLDAGPPRCESAGPGVKPRCPEGCALTSFVMEKR